MKFTILKEDIQIGNNMNANIFVQNLKCGGCAQTIKNKLSEITGIVEIEVHIESGLIEFGYDDSSILNDAKKLLKSIGYPDIDDANSMLTKAKSYVSCAAGKISK